MKFRLIATIGWLLFQHSHVVEGTQASPLPAKYSQPDGSETPELYLNGDERYAWLCDAEGYTVVKDPSTGWYVYAQKSLSGEMEPIPGANVGDINPDQDLGLKTHLYPDFVEVSERVEEENSFRDLRRRLEGSQAVRNCADQEEPCYLKQLGLLVRFADHNGRALPAPEDLNILFNHNGPRPEGAASTGSISDVYRENSFDKVVLDTHLTPWIDISCTEEYASAGQNGFNHEQTRECWAEALQKYADTLAPGSLDQFDGDSDGFFDGIAIVHSGVAAEENGPDCETQAEFQNRIWSHAVPQASNFEFLGTNGIDLGIKVGRFFVFSALDGKCPSDGPYQQWGVGRIGVPVHEAGHFFGLPDLYGNLGKSRGIGNWGFMGNSYGWDATGHWPGLLSGYSRYLLGWVKVVDVTYTQSLTITAACDSDIIYRIKHRMASDADGEEFFLLENRCACGHDLKLVDAGEDRQGLAIWHVDHTMILGQNAGKDVIRYDTTKTPDDGVWPGVHSRVSLLQGDGLYGLENNKDRGSQTNLFRLDTSALKGSRAKKISDDGVLMNDGSTKQYPNTKSIATGAEKATGITIEVLDEPGHEMRVKVTLVDEDGAEVLTDPAAVAPTDPPVAPTDPPVAPTDPPVEPVTLEDESVGSGAAANDVDGGQSANVLQSLPQGTGNSAANAAADINSIGLNSVFTGFDYQGAAVEAETATEPPATEPPATEPPATEPPVTEPPATEPPATEPPATEPPATEPPATEPPATEPPATEPPATEPPATEPPATEPPATEPPATEPPATEPPATEPPATEPPATEPPATEPPATEPPATEPPETDPPETEAPAATEDAACSNSSTDLFKITGYGNSPAELLTRQCMFINPDKRDVTELCNWPNTNDSGREVFHVCPRECHAITGCPPPDPERRLRGL